MTVFASSDLHFGHKNLLKFQPNRSHFSSVDEMDETIINNINEDVLADDTLYLLGDISFRSDNHTIELLNRINCQNLHLIIGNHDKHFLKKDEFRNRFISINHKKIIKHNKIDFVMSHCPFRTWDNQRFGAIHIFGHLHSNPPDMYGRSMDVGMDGNNMRVWKLDNIIDVLSTQEITTLDAYHRN